MIDLFTFSDTIPFGRSPMIGLRNPLWYKGFSGKKTLSSTTMAIELTPLPLPPSADPSKFADFGRQVTGVHPGNFTPDEFNDIREALYKVRRRPSGERELNADHLFAARRSLVSGCCCDARAAVCIDKGVQSSKRLT